MCREESLVPCLPKLFPRALPYRAFQWPEIVGVFRELQKRRQSSRVFQSKQGFATPRDLFRWACCDAVRYQELAEHGYMLLVERARREDDKVVVKEVKESIMKNLCFWWEKRALGRHLSVSSMRKFSPSIYSETADLIGGLRPVRNRASSEAGIIRDANAILERAGIDVIPSDSQQLLSRINTLLKTGKDLDPSFLTPLRDIQENLNWICSLFEWHDGPIHGDYPAIHASNEFKLLATMTPGVDYGKKELSTALRNHFTEIWVPAPDSMKPFTGPLLQFTNWLRDTVRDPAIFSLRDILAWVTFANAACSGSAETFMLPAETFHQAAQLNLDFERK
ncbi:hypothetical protein BDR05DRAFT_1005586 [Suillus weaverae]|nr:hypothetical protein BDR05DRAFT_1005586 [Suillus weaverae]